MSFASCRSKCSVALSSVRGRIVSNKVMPFPSSWMTSQSNNHHYGCSQAFRICRLSSSESQQASSAGPIISGTIPPHGQGVAIGQQAQLRRTFTPSDVAAYADLIQDHNLLHQECDFQSLSPELQSHPLIRTDENNGTKTKIVVHGMLVSTFFSSIFGTLVPGAIYMKQSLHFLKPVYANQPLIATVTIQNVKSTRRGGIVVICETTVQHAVDDTTTQEESSARDQYCLKGEASIWLVNGYEQTHT